MKKGFYISHIGDYWYAFHWDDDRGQVKSLRGDEFAQGRIAESIKYVSYPYASRSSAYNAIRREQGIEGYMGIYEVR